MAPQNNITKRPGMDRTASRRKLVLERLESRLVLSATLADAGISARVADVINASAYTDIILADAAFQNTVQAIANSQSVPISATVLTSVSQFSQIQSGGTYLIQGDFTLANNTTIDVPSNVTIYVDGSIYKQGSFTAPGGVHSTENGTDSIFRLSGSDNVRLIGINNARLHSNPNLLPTAPHTTGIYIDQNADNIEVDGFLIENVWEGIVARSLQIDNVTITNNYIRNTLKRAIWSLGAQNLQAAHNFIENAGVDGLDWDAYTFDAIGYENVVVGNGRWAGFVEEGAQDSFFIRGVAVMVELHPSNVNHPWYNPNVGYQMAWADNGSSQNFVNNNPNPAAWTQDNYFIDNVVFRPSGFPDGGDYFAKENAGKGPTYFWANRGYGAGQSTTHFDNAEWLDIVPVQGGANNAVFAQQMLADLAVTYEVPDDCVAVIAGETQSVQLPNHSVILNGDVTSLPVGGFVNWSIDSAPHPVHFADPGILDTEVFFAGPGTYELRLEAMFSGNSLSDTVTIHVTEPLEPTVLIEPVDDAYLEAGQGQNFSHLKISGDDDQSAFLKFDLAGQPASSVAVTLHMTVRTNPGDGQLEVFEGDSNGWTETDLTNANAPQPTDRLDSVVGTFNVGDTVLWDVSGATINDETLTVIVSQQPGGDETWFGSQESTVSPTLQLGRRLTIAPGDFNADSVFDCTDIDELVSVVVAGQYDPYFDLNADLSVGATDVLAWLGLAGAANLPSGSAFLLGDANLDGNVDGQDFVQWNAHKFLAGTGWCGGDFNVDGVTDGQDFVIWNSFKFTSSDQGIQRPGDKQVSPALSAVRVEPSGTPARNALKTLPPKRGAVSLAEVRATRAESDDDDADCAEIALWVSLE